MKSVSILLPKNLLIRAYLHCWRPDAISPVEWPSSLKIYVAASLTPPLWLVSNSEHRQNISTSHWRPVLLNRWGRWSPRCRVRSGSRLHEWVWQGETNPDGKRDLRIWQRGRRQSSRCNIRSDLRSRWRVWDGGTILEGAEIFGSERGVKMSWNGERRRR